MADERGFAGIIALAIAALALGLSIAALLIVFKGVSAKTVTVKETEKGLVISEV